MIKAKAPEKVTHVGFHFRVWVNNEKQEVVIDSHLFDTEDICKTYWIEALERFLPESDDNNEEKYDFCCMISGTFNYDWFGQTNYRVVDIMFSEAIRDYCFDAWEKKRPIRDYGLESWIEKRIFGGLK